MNDSRITRFIKSASVMAALAPFLAGCEPGIEDAVAQPPSDPFWTGGPGYPHPGVQHSETWTGDGLECSIGDPDPEPPLHTPPVAGNARLRLERRSGSSDRGLHLVPQGGFSGFPDEVQLKVGPEDGQYVSNGTVQIGGHPHNLTLIRDGGSSFCLGLRDAVQSVDGGFHGGDVHFSN